MKSKDWNCPSCGAHITSATDNDAFLVGCPQCGWMEGQPMPIPPPEDKTRIERLVFALIGSPSMKVPLSDVVLIAAQINEKIKQAESGVVSAVPKSRVADKVEWPTDE